MRFQIHANGALHPQTKCARQKCNVALESKGVRLKTHPLEPRAGAQMPKELLAIVLNASGMDVDELIIKKGGHSCRVAGDPSRSTFLFRREDFMLRICQKAVSGSLQ
jgi:hypothetical protein